MEAAFSFRIIGPGEFPAVSTAHTRGSRQSCRIEREGGIYQS